MTRTILLLLLASASGGCAALTNPVADGVPVNRIPPEALPRPKAELRPLPLTLLRQKPPEVYLLDAGDVLAVVASEILGPGDQLPPINRPDQPGQIPVVGYPIPIREDGTISLPLLPPIPVRGKTVKEVERLLFDTITGRTGGPELVKPNAARVSVQLYQRRQIQVLVTREDSAGGGAVGPGATGGGIGGGIGANLTPTATGGGGTGKRGLSFSINLPAGENDVFHALNATGGLPGLDAKNEVVIVRGGRNFCDAADAAARTIRIPLRVYPDQPISIREDDIILRDGDVVSIEARDREVFYTAGLIGTGVFPLPRDIDLDILQAVAFVRGPLANGSFSQTAFSSSAVNGGLGNPNASLVSVLRQLPEGRQLVIRVDLNKALRDPRERILVQPGDFIVFQETPGEATLRYMSQKVIISYFFNIFRSEHTGATGAGVIP